MSRTPFPVDTTELEDQLRAALRHRAEETPITDDPPSDIIRLDRAQATARRPWRRGVVVVGAAAAAAAAVVALAQVAPSTTDDIDTSPAAPTAPVMPDAEVPRLVIEGASLRMDEGEGASPFTDNPTMIRQSFRRTGRLDGPMIFLTTLRPYNPLTFGLVTGEHGDPDPVVLRGRTGYVGHYNGELGATYMSVELGDGDAIYLIAIGLSDDELVEFVDGLAPGPDGRWVASVSPQGVAEVDAAPPPTDGRYYGGQFELPDVASISVNLYQDGFEYRLADRVASTVAPVEVVDVDGHPATLGSYTADGWWVMLEPEPGRALELQIGGDRTVVDEVLARARFVDEASWDAVTSAP